MVLGEKGNGNGDEILIAWPFARRSGSDLESTFLEHLVERPHFQATGNEQSDSFFYVLSCLSFCVSLGMNIKNSFLPTISDNVSGTNEVAKQFGFLSFVPC